MTKIDNFKSFVRRNPNLITYVREKNTSWQEFYELYDLYGEDPTIWNKYLNKEFIFCNIFKIYFYAPSLPSLPVSIWSHHKELKFMRG